MREIKFRELARLNTGSVEWFYYTISTGYAIEVGHGIQYWIVKDSQYTGLKDKNGKEIYEGDIILFTDDLPHVVIFGEYQHYFNTSYHDMFYGWWLRKWRRSEDKRYEEGFPLSESYSADIEVIGNIYENHELLEKEKEK